MEVVDTNLVDKFKNFIGFVYKFCYSNYAKTTFEDCRPRPAEYSDPICKKCPQDEPPIISCDWNKYFDEATATCQDCDVSCTEGCRRPTDCNVCLDNLCISCANFETCTACVENTTLISTTVWTEQCVCIANFYESLLTCEPCDPACHQCYESTNYDCTECNDPFRKAIDIDACLPSCATGFTPVGTECTGDPGTVICLLFGHEKVDNWTDAISGVVARGGDSSESDERDPMWTYNRGIYFAEQDYIVLESIMLHHTFSI